MAASTENPETSVNTIRIRADHLSVAYDEAVALSSVTFDTTGNVIAVLGHNGAGKSTLIKTVLGLLPARSGSFVITGRDARGECVLSPEQHMAFCPESGAVFADISVESYIAFWCRVKHRNARYYRTHGKDILELLELPPLLRKYGRQLSKGQRRRVQTAVGFLINPYLFLFDEPFDGLDVQKTSELAEIIHMYSSRMSFMISSHRMDVIERLADRVLVLKEGKLISYGETEQVCTELAGTTVEVSVAAQGESGDLHKALEAAFPACVINSIGEHLTVTGHEATSQAIESTLSTPAVVRTTAPSLVDAVNYHLRKLRRDRSSS